MNSINSWINEDEVRKLAEDLAASPEEMKGWPSDDFDDFDGFAIPEKQGEGSSNPVSKDLEIFPENDSKTEIDIGQEVKKSKSSSLAVASAMAASVGLIGKSQSEPVKESIVDTRPAEPDAETFTPLCDHCLNEVPVNIDENARVTLPRVHPDKGIGTFEQIDKTLAKTVKANGICVISVSYTVLTLATNLLFYPLI